MELHRIIRENSKDETEYKRYVDSLKASVLTAFYTPKAITDTIADVLHDKKVRPNLVLEPSAGMGAFIGSVLSDNPQQKIRTEGFEKIEKPFLNRFDLAISNIPFGDIAVFDPEYANGSVFKKIAARKVHTYFFLKGLDAVRDGGIVAFITSQGVLNTESNGGTRYMMTRKADLVSAIRLPNNLFTEDANTEVGCDLIILQKNEGKEELSEEDKRLGDVVKSNHTNIVSNGYFLDHPERIIHTDAISPLWFIRTAVVWRASQRICTKCCRRTCRHGWTWNAIMASRKKGRRLGRRLSYNLCRRRRKKKKSRYS